MTETTLPGWPRGLRAELAAAYLGMGRTTFDAGVKSGDIPKPVRTVATIAVWDRHELDRWLDDKRGVAQGEGRNEWDAA